MLFAARFRPVAAPPTAFLLLLLGVVAVGALTAGPVAAQSADGPLPVQTVRVEIVSGFEAAEAYAGRVAARRTSGLSFERPGVVETIAVEEGDRVLEGTVLAKLDTRALEAEREVAGARVDEADAQLALARSTLERQRVLLERDNASAQRVDEARRGVRVAEAQLAQARATVRSVEAALALSRLVAPYDGQVTARTLDEGALASPGTTVLELIEDGPLELRVGVPGDLAGGLEPGRAYPVRWNGRDGRGRLVRLVDRIDPATRTALAILHLDTDEVKTAGGETPMPGDLANLIVTRRIAQPGFWVPLTALTEGRRGLWSVFVAEEDARGRTVLSRRPVEILHIENDRVFARGTVYDGERVVATGVHRAVPNQEVAVNEVSLDNLLKAADAAREAEGPRAVRFESN